MALESVEYSEERAIQILNIVIQEDNPAQTLTEEIKQEPEADDENEKLRYFKIYIYTLIIYT